MINKISIDDFIKRSANGLVIDVRSPSEFAHAHIPGAVSVPLFTDEERAIIGTAYKQESKEKAVKIGLNFFGPKMVKLVEAVEQLVAAETPQVPIYLHCWRGGMRSAAVAWLLNLYGFEVTTIVGGYKAYRHWVLQQFEENYAFKVIGGCTGSGKTRLLHQLQAKGFVVIDLEGLANHKGSAFGNIGMPPQPSQEMFENKLGTALFTEKLKGQPIIFIEDESQRIGNVNVPIVLYKQMRESTLLFLEIPFEERLKNIVAEYGKGDTEKLVNAIIRIKKRLGGLETKTAINHLLEGDVAACFSILLLYYDKWYTKSITNLREHPESVLQTIPCANTEAALDAIVQHGSPVQAKVQ